MSDLRGEAAGVIAAREASFEAEAARFALRFRCAACAHVVASTRACSMGYPNHYLRGPLRGLSPAGEPLVCKYFELGESELSDGDALP